jgi:orotate phosphoribosyltransferase
MIESDILSALPGRDGHFLLESGYHSNLWVPLDGLFRDPTKAALLVTALAAKLSSYEVTAVCGPTVGGAFLALAVARELGKRFYFTVPRPSPAGGLFKVEYALPPELHRMVKGERLAVVDDAISAGSSARATKSALDDAGASTIVAAALMTFGDTGVNYFARHGIPIEFLSQREFMMWKPDECPRCRSGEPLVDP